jgi:light-regulated signal transduction histidine kinase (bacteriophytochrome)
VDLTALSEALVADLRARDPHRDVAVSIMPGLEAQADARMVRLALEHLLGNAWKYTSRIEAATIAVSGAQQGAVWTYSVQDNGAGFDMTGYERLFGPFQRLHGEAEFPGLGIGLATVQRIVHRHGGRIQAEGRVGGGARLTFTLQPD